MAERKATKPAVRKQTATKQTATKQTATKQTATKQAAAEPPVTKQAARKRPTAPKTAERSPQNAGQDDPLVVALEVWRSVVAGLEQARYAEIGPAYAQLSSLLVQQRTAELLTGTGQRAEWAELSATAQQAVTLLQPVMTAARELVELPSRIEADAGTRTAPTGAGSSTQRRPARRRSSRT